MPSRNAASVILSIAAFFYCAEGRAVDGIVLIDQNRALAGNVTPGDAPGFPVTISRPGSYRLSGNLTVPNEQTNGIAIASSDVSIDLNGFGIFGPGRASSDWLNFGIGIDGVNGFETNISIRNGTIAGMGGAGILIGGDSGEVINVRAHNNAGAGISVGRGYLVSGNTAAFNRFGIWTQHNSVVRGNVARGEGRGGEILVGCFPFGTPSATSTIVGNVATGGIVGANNEACTRDQNSPAP